MEIKLDQNDKNLFKFIGLVIFLGFWTWLIFFYGRDKPGLYEITLKSININGDDFHVEKYSKDPLFITLFIYKDGKEIFKKELGRLRGKKEYEHVYFKLTNSNRSKYLIKFREKGKYLKGGGWDYPNKPKDGNWLFNRKIIFGNNKIKPSYIKFESRYLE